MGWVFFAGCRPSPPRSAMNPPPALPDPVRTRGSPCLPPLDRSPCSFAAKSPGKIGKMVGRAKWKILTRMLLGNSVAFPKGTRVRPHVSLAQDEAVLML